MKNKTKQQLFLLLTTLAVGTLLAACSSKGSQSQTGTKVDKAKEEKIEDMQLRDNDSLYANRDDTSVVTMYLTVRRGNSSEGTDHSWQEINGLSAYDYERMGVDRYKVAGLLQVGDDNGPQAGQFGFDEAVPNATVQVRGQSSSKGKQKNYKIKIKKTKGKWEGQRTINLNKHVYEGLRFRNKLAYDLLEGIPQIMSLRTQFVHLYVKDETGDGQATFQDYGLYTQVEQLNKTALEAHGLDRNANLYKVNNFEFRQEEDKIVKEDDAKFDKKKFEELLEIKGDHDHTKLVNTLKRVNDPSVSADDLLKKDFDAENIQYWMAFQILMGNIDTKNRNMYLYSPQLSSKWYILPWDNDAVFLKTEREYLGDDKDSGNSWEVGVSNYWGNILFQRLLKSDKFREGLNKAVNDLKQYLTEDRINEMSRKYASVVQPYLAKMPDEAHARLTPPKYEEVLNRLPKEVERNYQAYVDSLHKPQPFFISDPTIENGKMHLAWETAYDFSNKDVSYHLEVAKDYNFNDKVLDQDNLRSLTFDTDTLPKGQYFIRITATNSDGASQRAFDTYFADSSKFYGIKSFYVLEDGKIGADNYVD
ncbi:CotH kinase family protein [Streptococcus oricebi]|uniref:Spore coat protein CotH n=1 Tax=Streptococcus oricebi TaxID=1547447 RepID=A0ABS5B493_9STRE|nr:CotH kinase family protein [Streptococcus oricebi]MBP2623648.1 spore coat protein CotH [Streptococcus oricebi]